MSLFGGGSSEEPARGAGPAVAEGEAGCRIGLAVKPALGIEVGLDVAGLREALEDPSLPKQVHDLKAVLRALEPHGVEIAGEITDVMLQSYLVNPTHGSHTLVDIAARTTSRALTHQPTKENPTDPKRLPEAAAAIARLAMALREQMDEASVVEHAIPKDEPGLGGALTTEMLFADGSGENGEKQVPRSGKDKKKGKDKGETQIPFGDDSQSAGTALNEHSSLDEVYRGIDLPLVP